MASQAEVLQSLRIAQEVANARQSLRRSGLQCLACAPRAGEARASSVQILLGMEPDEPRRTNSRRAHRAIAAGN